MNLHEKDHAVVENSLTQALFELMSIKPFSEISITELVQRAGVGRATYYRNYSCKEEIIQSYINKAMMEFLQKYPIKRIEDRYSENHLRNLFEFMTPYVPLLTVLHRSGLGFMYLDILNKKLMQIHQNDIHDRKDYLVLLAFAGAEFNIVFTEFVNNKAETEELTKQVSELFYRQFQTEMD